MKEILRGTIQEENPQLLRRLRRIGKTDEFLEEQLRVTIEQGKKIREWLPDDPSSQMMADELILHELLQYPGKPQPGDQFETGEEKPDLLQVMFGSTT